MKKVHNYHLVDNSPWPITVSISLLSMIIGIIMTIYHKSLNQELLGLSLISLLISVYLWLKEIILEGTFEGYHTYRVQKTLTIGFILFIISEICVFSTLFFSYFYNSLIPSIEIGSLWPPIGIETLDAKAIPLLNTVILFISGITATYSHNMLISRYRNKAIKYLWFTIILGIIFSYFQYYEYYHSLFTISDSVYGCSFYTLTGFHGVHVIMGIIFLIVALIRIYLRHFTSNHSLNLTFANLYWHFVDYVWIILFICLYCWAS